MELQVSLPKTEKHRNESEQDLFVSVVRYIVQVTEILELWDESVIEGILQRNDSDNCVISYCNDM
jgi:predicted glycosyl hydrolase (DUF1957 family)